MNKEQRFGELQIITGNANPELARKIAGAIGIPMTPCCVGQFPDGEIEVRLNEDVRGNDVFVVQPTCGPVNDNLMELLLMLDTLTRASAGRITAVIPYFGYARKDFKDEGRVPISAKLVANMIVAAGAQRVLAMELHSPQLQGFFDVPVDHLYAAPIFVEHFEKKDLKDPVVVAPDVGGIKLARAYAKRLNGGLAIVDKRRYNPKEAKAMHLIGEVKDRDVILMDDMITTAGTMTEAVRMVHKAGCRRAFVAATHGVFVGPAVDRLREVEYEELVVTDSVPTADSAKEMVSILTASKLLGEAMLRIHASRSVSSLFVD